MVFDASFCASLPHYRGAGGEAYAEGVVDICPIFYMDNLGAFDFQPTEYVDITDVFDVKMQMLACHESQVGWMLRHDKINFGETVRTFSRMRGVQSGTVYAEGFRQLLGWGRIRTKRLLP